MDARTFVLFTGILGFSFFASSTQVNKGAHSSPASEKSVSQNPHGTVAPQSPTTQLNPSNSLTSKEHKIPAWQKQALSLYQVQGERFLFDGKIYYQAANIKNSVGLETDRAENFISDLSFEYGINQQIAIRGFLGYQTGQQKNSLSTTKIQGFQDVGIFAKMRWESVATLYSEAGVEVSPERLNVNVADRNLNAVSGGTKLVVKGGVSTSARSWLFGGALSYRYFVQREVDLKTSLDNETYKINGGNQLELVGFLEFGSSLRIGAELSWFLQENAQYDSVNFLGISDYEKTYSILSLAGYLKIPLNDKMMVYFKGGYGSNVIKRRGNENYDQDELFTAQAGVQAQF